MIRGTKISFVLGFLVAIFAIIYFSYEGDYPQKVSEQTHHDRESDELLHSYGSDVNVEQNDERARVKKIASMMAPYIEILDLKNKTVDQIREATYVDFSTLNPYTMPEDPEEMAKIMFNILAIQLVHDNIRPSTEKLHPSDRKKYDLRKFNNGIVGLGVENFMTAATQFCEEEAAAGKIPIVSIGSGDGTVEKEIIAQYRERFGKDIRIQLVDPDPKFDGIVDFKTVDHLIAENPRIVGNCVAFIIWSNPTGNVMEQDAKDFYDIEAVRKLQPRAVLTVYESTGGSGSVDFRNFLHEEYLDDLSPEEFGVQNYMDQFLNMKKSSYGLDNYSVVELARQKVTLARFGTFILRMVKIIRTN